MSAHSPDRPPDDPFAGAYASLVDDLATVLDLTPGADEVTHSATYDTLTADLTIKLHLDVGLGAIISGFIPASSTSGARRLVDYLGSFTDLERLGLRTHPSYRRLRGALVLVLTLDRAHDLARDLAHDLDHAHDDTRDLDHVLDRDHALDLVRVHDLDRDRSLDLVRALDLDHDLDHATAVKIARRTATALAYALGIIRARARARANAPTLARELAHGRDLAHDLACHLICVRKLAHDLARNLARDLNLNLDLDLDLRSIAHVLEELTEAADNFVGADLRAAVNFDSTDWEGIRWSPATLWPPGWAERVHAISVEIAPGIFEVVLDGRDSLSLHKAGT